MGVSPYFFILIFLFVEKHPNTYPARSDNNYLKQKTINFFFFWLHCMKMANNIVTTNKRCNKIVTSNSLLQHIERSWNN